MTTQPKGTTRLIKKPIRVTIGQAAELYNVHAQTVANWARAGLPVQRIVVIGDGDFLSDTYLGNAGNLSLGLNIVQWLSHDEAALSIRIKSAPDTSLVLGKVAQAVIGLGFLIGLPLLLLLTGLLVWLLRRRR